MAVIHRFISQYCITLKALILQKIKYKDYSWIIYGDFKILSTLLGQQLGFATYPFFLYMWNSKAHDLHWKKTEWSIRNALTVGENNVTNVNLVLLPAF